MKKLLGAFSLLIASILLPLSVYSADQAAEIPPPPDIESTNPPPMPSAADPTNDLGVPPAVPTDTTTNKTAAPTDKTSDSSLPPPIPASDDSAKVKIQTTDKPVDSVSAPPPAVKSVEKASKSISTKTSKKSKKTVAPLSKKASKSKTSPKSQPVETAAEAEAVKPAPQPTPVPAGPNLTQLVTAYKYAYELYAAQQFDKAKELFKKISMVTDEPTLKANSLYYYSQCAFRTEDYIGCVKGLKVLVKKVPDCSAIKKGFVARFCVFLIDQAANHQTNWDYFRYQVQNDENGNPVWKESIPPGPKIKRINFRLGFGLYTVLHAIQPDSPEDIAAKQKLQKMLDTPITVVWVDEKAPKTKYGHSGDFLSLFSTNEKKDFSKVICQRMFFNFETEYFYKFLDMHDDVRNLKPRFVAVNKVLGAAAQTSAPPPILNAAGGPITTAISTEEDPNQILTLYNLMHVAGYYPWLDSYTNTIEAAPTDLNL